MGYIRLQYNKATPIIYNLVYGLFCVTVSTIHLLGAMHDRYCNTTPTEANRKHSRVSSLLDVPVVWMAKVE